MKSLPGVDFDKFRENLSIIRRIDNITARKLAEELGLRQIKRISDIEEGKGRPELDEILAICNYFTVCVDDMLHRRCELKGEFK